MSYKKILLLGESIMYGVGQLRGYGYFLQQKLLNKAEVYLPTDNCQDIRYLYKFANELIPKVEGGFDIIHWNNGLWDVLHFVGNPDPHTPIEIYKQKILDFYEKLNRLFPRADIFWATTTSIPEHMQKTSCYRRNSEIIKYNDVARKALEGKVKAIDDLYIAAQKMDDSYRHTDGLHYSEKGASFLAEVVYDFLFQQGEFDCC